MASNMGEDSQFIALEFIDGVELIEFLKCKGALRESVARNIFKILVSALQYIHQSGLVHRDIKSDNVMITYKCLPHILDFGFASKISGDLENGYFATKLGTPAYMAPEIHQGAPYDGVKGDIFALAVILFQMVLGRPPFEEAT